MPHLEIPQSATWDSVIIRFISGDSIDIRAGGRPIGIKHYMDIGFHDIRTGDSDPLWGVLKYLAKVNGDLSYEEMHEKEAAPLKKNISRLRDRLKTGFGIADDPFHPYYKSGAFRTRFIISGTP